MKWEGSYTKQVVDALEASWAAIGGMPPEEQAAADLLKQYHRDLQVPYQQRDEARADAENWHNIATEALKQRDEARADAENWHNIAAEARADAESWHNIATEARVGAKNWHNIATEALKQRDDVKEASVLLGAEMVKYLRAAEEARDAYRKIAVARGEKLVKIAGLL
jgi:uncharacterized coiled-coil DUF342 family protein